MILPGDILWEQYRVLNVESNSAARAWLIPTQPSTPKSTTSVGPHLLLNLQKPTDDPLIEVLSMIWQTRQNRTLDLIPLGMGLLGQIEFRGEPSSGTGAALIACPAEESLHAHLTEAATPGFTLRILAALTDSLMIEVLKFFGKDKRNDALFRALSKLLNPKALGIYEADGQPELGLCMPPPPSQDDGKKTQTPSSQFQPPDWAAYCAPEVLRGASCGEAALVYGIGQLGRALLLGGTEDKEAASGPWTQFSLDVLGKRDASKEFLNSHATRSIPKELSALVSKCLKPKPATRFSTLAKLGAALKKLKGLDWAQDRGPSSFPAMKAIVKSNPDAVQVPKGMVAIEAGSYLAGEKKIARTLKAFAIDKIPVTELAYKNYLKETQKPAREGGPGTRAAKFDDHPVVNATWKEAEEYASFYGYRLPTVHEWEKAARGTDGRKFPYGASFLPGTGKLRATAPGAGQPKESARSTAPAGSFPLGASPFGIMDMAGNVLEWTSTGRRQGKRMFRALKGSCFLDGSVELSRCAGMQFRQPDISENFIGFRCVMDID